MKISRNPWRSGKKGQMVVAAILACLMAAGAAEAQKKNKKKDTAQSTDQKRIVLDKSKIVWPNPPAIARIKFEDILAGEKIDWAAIDASQSKKQKQSWMDRLAGTRPDA